jgi:hypothetical protein
MARTLNFVDQRKQSVSALVIVSAATSMLTALLLFAFVLPAYYGIDPTGWGEKLGITNARTQTGAVNVENKTQPPLQTAAQMVIAGNPAPLATAPQADDPLAERQDTVELVIPPKQSLDYRLAMERDYELDYHWTANGKAVSTELRGEPKDGKTPSLTFSTLKNSTTGKGFFIIPFNGKFGWHWQNKTNQPVTIRLHTKGTYQVVGQGGTQHQSSSGVVFYYSQPKR